jgi:hypothetical protein
LERLEPDGISQLPARSVTFCLLRNNRTVQPSRPPVRNTNGRAASPSELSPVYTEFSRSSDALTSCESEAIMPEVSGDEPICGSQASIFLLHEPYPLLLQTPLIVPRNRKDQA